MGSIPITRSKFFIPRNASLTLNIVINGEQREIAQDMLLSALLSELELSGRRLAVELNGSIVPRGNFETTTLKHDDRVEIVHAIGGG